MSNATLEVVNPFDLKPIGAVALKQWDDIDRYLETAKQLHQNRKGWMPAYQRVDILQKAAVLMQGRFEELAYLIANEGGKPLVDARVEVARAIDGVKLCIKEIPNLAGKQIPMDLTAAGAGRTAFTQREPIGPVIIR
jgi:acyl-CoA reductase-like NAD-dependent aldehyde dehydrogenase